MLIVVLLSQSIILKVLYSGHNTITEQSRNHIYGFCSDLFHIEPLIFPCDKHSEFENGYSFVASAATAAEACSSERPVTLMVRVTFASKSESF